MHCPRCGQQQVSEETKFCLRCGFPLGLISEILVHGGFLPQLVELYQSKTWLTKKKGVVFSIIWMIFFVFIMAPFWSIVDVEKLAAVSAVIGIFGSLILLISSLVFLKSLKTIPFPVNELPNANVNTLHGADVRGLPSQQSQPAQSYVPPMNSWKAPNTGEYSQPNSVIENTTKLLKKDD